MVVIRKSEALAAPEQLVGVSIVRVSEQGKREDDRFISPAEQQQRIDDQAAHDGVVLSHKYVEIDVSGKLPLSKRPGMKRAVEHVEAGEAQVIYVAYFDRLARNNKVRGEIVDRVEAIGQHCSVYAVGFGAVSHRTSTARVTSELLGIMSEFYARSTGEKTAAARENALDRGIVVFPYVPLGYVKDPETRKLVVEPAAAKLVVESFRMRSSGATIEAIREYLREAGRALSYRQVALMFDSKLYLGEINDGDMCNPNSHKPIVDRLLWQQAHEVKVPRGRHPREPRLLSKLGVVVCASCGYQLFAAMKAQRGHFYPLYRCPGGSVECKQPVAISALQLEAYVTEQLFEQLDGISEPGHIEAEVEAAELWYAARVAELNTAVEQLAGIKSASVKPTLAKKQAAVDDAAKRLQRARNAAGPRAVIVSARANWTGHRSFTFDEKRALIASTFGRIVVSPALARGRGGRVADRVSCEVRE